MDLIDADGLVGALPLLPARQPAAVLPVVLMLVADDGSGGGWNLVRPSDRVRFQRQDFPVNADDLVFVELASGQARNKQLPDADTQPFAHGMAPSVPGVEIADHADAARIG